jgi:RNA polymerase sigma factor (sigma-70 family)
MRKTRARPPEVEWSGEEDAERKLPPIPAPAATEPLRHLFQSYRQRQIQAAISDLPERSRLVFILAHREERKLAEIAEILEIPEGTVKSRLYTAVRALRGRLTAEDENGSEETP